MYGTYRIDKWFRSWDSLRGFRYRRIIELKNVNSKLTSSSHNIHIRSLFVAMLPWRPNEKKSKRGPCWWIQFECEIIKLIPQQGSIKWRSGQRSPLPKNRRKSKTNKVVAKNRRRILVHHHVADNMNYANFLITRKHHLPIAYFNRLPFLTGPADEGAPLK